MPLRHLLACGLLLAMPALGGGAELEAQYRQAPAHWPSAALDAGVVAEPLAALPEKVSYPADNPYSEARRELGKRLFFERRLSASEQVACASCHDPELGWADGRRMSIGHNRQKGQMNAPSILNAAFLHSLFWDGRVTSLEEQALASWTNPVEMAGQPDEVAVRLSGVPGYGPLFEQAYGSTRVDPLRIVQALATFVRSMSSLNSPFDRFMRGDFDALDDAQIRGLHLFRTKARCIHCHNGPLLSDGKFHHLGTSFHTVGNYLGRYAQTARAEHVGAFRTPPLRGLSTTAPYMHNGFVADLDMLLALYNMGWWQNAPASNKNDLVPLAQLSPLIKPLDLDPRELADLKAFLLSLDGDMRYLPMPDELPEATTEED